MVFLDEGRSVEGTAENLELSVRLVNAAVGYYADFREEIRAAGAASEPQALPGDGRCRWLRVYCAKLGRVVSPGRCPGCDEAVPALEGTLR